MGGAVQLFLIIALVAVATTTFGAKIPWLSQFGITFFGVTSGSMEPTIPTGSLVRVGKYNLENLKEGDIITYQFQSEGQDKPSIVTHRIAKVTKTETKDEGNSEVAGKTFVSYEFKTKGDANNSEDSYSVGATNIIGLYKGHVPQLGYLTMFAQTRNGFLLLVILPAAILIVWEVISLVLHFKQEYALQSEKEIEKLKAELAAHKKDHV